jgi:hypothetical protein
MMLEIEVFMQNHVFCRILDCYSSPGQLEISPGGEIFGQAKLTAHHVLSIRFVASMGYLRLDLAVPY